MEQQRISVIVPVYKVEPFLDRCVQSIVGQTYQNLEIILVDDGSPDNCPAMCDAWAKKDDRVKVVHKRNGGLSDARNAGMTVATGTLMGFVDSDDWLSPEMYQLLFENMVETNSDIAACGVEMVWEDGTESQMLTRSGCCVLNGEEAMRACIAESWLKQPVWYKLYKAELIRNVPFPVGKVHEDVFWTYQVIGRANRVSVMDTPCYHYLQRSGSIMGEGYSLKRLDALEAKRRRQAYLQEHMPNLAAEARVNLLFSCMYAMQMSLIHLSGRDRKVAKEIIRDALADCCPSCVFPRATWKQKTWCALASISFEGTCRLRNVLGIGI